ncbi:DUF4082 domain-containing protein [Mesorhizobium loti]|uniref:DUF4082 domain-containing protein n=1 Tax=Rhizobium loti TaxID=381 RepID=UPI001FD8C79D|nr:DUF4082 domain-containing protein [Mesorhizobium loti]
MTATAPLRTSMPTGFITPTLLLQASPILETAAATGTPITDRTAETGGRVVPGSTVTATFGAAPLSLADASTGGGRESGLGPSTNAPFIPTQTLIVDPTAPTKTPSVALETPTEMQTMPFVEAVSSNPIVAENQKPGTPVSVWGLHGSLDGVGDSNIEGFATQISINHGQTVNFKIDTSATKYRIDIYRLGYYGGDGATLVTSFGENLASPQIQPNPLFDPQTNEIDAGNWDVSASWSVPVDATSGVYIAKLTRTDGITGQNIIPFIVRADDATSDITFQTSDSTWQAYNSWGGYNFYAGPGGRDDRAYAISYNRPIETNSTDNFAGPQDFVFGEEFPAIQWLEQNGYNVSYISSVDAATNPASVLSGKAYLDVGHDEYWSASQYNNVQAAANAGVNLAFLSGNETYWDISYAPSIDASATANRTMVEYKDPWDAQQLNPNGTAGGGSSTFRDPVYGPGTPENGLTGSIFQVDDDGTLGNITLTSQYSKLAIWQNTAVANLTGNQTVTLTNLLGYEWDADNNNGFRPAGLIDLSSTTVPVGSLIIDQPGTEEGSGTATHNLTLYRNTQSGALIFGTGTVMWSWGLNGNHAHFDGLTAPTNPVVQQSMVNVLAEMGVLPATLQASLVFASQSADMSPPVSTISLIAGGQPISSNQIATISGTANDVGGGHVAIVEISTDGGANWSRATGTTNWTYSWIAPAAGTYTVETRAVDDNAYLETPSDAITVSVSASTSTSLFKNSPGDTITYSTVSHNDNSGSPTAELGVKLSVLASGTISAIRFYKAVTDTGAHSVTLWTSSGAQLATAVSTNETASGWQTVTFAQPVSVVAGQTYVASYHSSGNYVLDTNYFVDPVSTPLLSTGANAGVTRAGSASAFPNQATSAGENFWVDVNFTPGVLQQLPPVANNDSGFTTVQNTALSITAASLLANDTDPNGDPLMVTGVGTPTNGIVSFNAQTNVVTFTPTSGFTGNGGFSYSLSDGHGGTASAQVVVAVNPLGTVENLFPTSTTPTVLADSDSNAVELGVKFSATVTGKIIGVSFYKSATDTGTHTGTLWSSTGTVLATGTFAGETSSGWQTLTFSSPVSIAAGATYVAGFHSNGHYAATPSFFTTAYANGDLSAPVNAGVYTYGASGAFPTSTYQGASYEVSVLFVPNTQTNQPPVANNDSGFTTVQNTALAIAAASLLGNDTDPDGDALIVTNVSTPTNGVVSLNSQTNVVTFTPTSGYTGNGGFSYSISDGHGGSASAQVALTVTSSANQPPVANNDSGFTTVQNTALSITAASLLANDTDPNGDLLTVTGVGTPTNGIVSFNAQTNVVTFTPTSGFTGNGGFSYSISDGHGGSASAQVALTVTSPANQPPVANNDSGFTTVQSTALSITAASLLANDTDPNGDLLTVTGVGTPTNGVVSFNSQTNVVTFTPTSGFTGNGGFSYSISDGHGGSASANVGLTVTPPAVTQSLFAANATPSTTTENDPNSVELGMKFTASAAGVIDGIRFYKGPQNTGAHTGSLWTSTGTLLGSLTFTNETTSGWQSTNFSNPISVTAGTTYIVSYHSAGSYSADSNYFSSAVSSGNLTAPSSAASGGNGVYAYGSGSAFPTSSYNASNYWVDVIYSPADALPNQPPVAANDSGFTTQQNTALNIAPASLLANDTDPNGDPLTISGVSAPTNGAVAFNAQTNTIIFTPTTGFTGNGGFSYSISDGRGGTASANVALTVTAPATTEHLFAASSTPATVNVNDTSPVELGMKFSASTSGSVTGVSFYKGAQNTGTHTGSLWTSTGTRLATATFTNETSSGWQTANFSSAVPITAGTTYIISYHTSGHYSANNNYFTNTVTTGSLTAPSSASSGGNGVYAYGSASAFPTSSFNSSNYWVDVLFNGQLAA